MSGVHPNFGYIYTQNGDGPWQVTTWTEQPVPNQQATFAPFNKLSAQAAFGENSNKSATQPSKGGGYVSPSSFLWPNGKPSR